MRQFVRSVVVPPLYLLFLVKIVRSIAMIASRHSAPHAAIAERIVTMPLVGAMTAVTAAILAATGANAGKTLRLSSKSTYKPVPFSWEPACTCLFFENKVYCENVKDMLTTEVYDR